MLMRRIGFSLSITARTWPSRRPGRPDADARDVAGRVDLQQARPRRRGLGEQVQPVVDRRDRGAPASAGMAEREQLIGRMGERVQVHAVDPEAGELEQRVDRPQRGRERVTDAAFAVAGDRIELVDPELATGGMRELHVARHAGRQGGGRVAREQVQDGRILRRARRDEAVAQRVAVDRQIAQSRIAAHEPGHRVGPRAGHRLGPGRERRSGQRQRREPAGDRVKLLQILGIAKARRARQDGRPRGRAVGGDLVVDVWLVADLERPQRAFERLHVAPRFGGRQRRLVGAEIDPDRQLRAERVDRRGGGRIPARRQLVGDLGRGVDPRSRSPGGIGAVTSDPDHRRLPR